MHRTAGFKLAVKKLTCLVGVKLTSVKADSGIVFEPLQPFADRKVLFCEELIPVFLLLIKSDIIDSSLETYSLKDFNGKVLICCQETIVKVEIFLEPKKFSNSLQGLKSAILAIFQRGPGWPCPVSAALKSPSVDLKNYFCFRFL